MLLPEGMLKPRPNREGEVATDAESDFAGEPFSPPDVLSDGDSDNKFEDLTGS